MFSFFSRFRYKVQMWMQGRYGIDELFKFLIGIAFAFLVLSWFPHIRFLYYGFALFTVLAYLRCFSRNIGARRKELYTYNKIRTSVMEKLKLYRKIWSERKTHKYFKCRKCKAVLRVPKGKGKIEVTCRVCREKQIKKS